MSLNLMRSRRFAPLFWTQFLSAFNDNLLKNTLVFLVLFQLAGTAAGVVTTLTGALFILPFLVLSALGGELADRHDKALVARRLKFAEIGVAALAVAGLAFGSIATMLASLAGFGVISALFGPLKYGILPDHLAEADLPRANAWIEGATFAAILGGTILGGALSARGAAGAAMAGVLMLMLAAGAWAASRLIPSAGPADPNLAVDRNVLRSTVRLLKDLHADRRLWRAGLILSWFWVVGAVILSVLPVAVTGRLGGNEGAVTACLAVFAVAVAAGSGSAAWLAKGRIILMPAPIGAALMALFGLDLAAVLSRPGAAAEAASLAAFFAGPGAVRATVDLAGVAFSGAFIAVPVFAAVQAWAPAARRARVIAAVNAVNAGCMALAGIVVAAAQWLGASAAGVMLGLSVAGVAAAVAMLRFLPTNAFRDLLSIVFRAFHRMEVEGLENLRAAGPAPILALNHVSFLDGALALTLTDAEPVFAIDHDIAKAWWVKPFLRVTRAMPLNPAKPMSTRTLIKAVGGGDPLVIFPEGRITVTGNLMKVYDGAAMVADRTGAPIVPIRIRGLERSFFSRLSSMQVRRALLPKVRVTILPAVRLEVPADLPGRKRRAAAGAALYRVMSDLVFRTNVPEATIPEAIAAAGARHGMGRLAVEDPVSGRLSYGRLLAGAAVLARRFARMFPGEPTLGLMLPNSNGAAAALIGLMSAGRVPAMINFTAGAASIGSGCTAAEVRTILSARAFVAQAKLGALVGELEAAGIRFVWLDDLRQSIGPLEKVAGFLHRARPLIRRKADDPAVILFTSGSEGTPKGVVLSHRNILANVAQAAARIDFGTSDKLFNVLPMFHSFGLTAGTILPLASGVPVYLYPSPLHYRIVPELIYGSNATILFGTDTFLAGYARTAHPYDFRSLRYCFSGAEPVKASTRQTYLDRFGLRILEGYGVTETAPVLAINTPMASRAGTVGKFLPGIEHRLEEVAGVEEGGRLFVRGPNVMLGYLRAEKPGAIEPPADGWHDTGDVVALDEGGFVRILGRAKRFAKIAGEMISLAAVEALAAELWHGVPSAAAAMPDPRKGERIILLTEAAGATREGFAAFAKGKGATELMIPAEIRVVDKVPLLGSGKIDFAAVADLARRKRGEAEAPKAA